MRCMFCGGSQCGTVCLQPAKVGTFVLPACGFTPAIDYPATIESLKWRIADLEGQLAAMATQMPSAADENAARQLGAKHECMMHGTYSVFASSCPRCTPDTLRGWGGDPRFEPKAGPSSSPAETLRRGVSILLADHVYDYGGKIVTVARVTLECIASDGTRFTIDGDSVRPMPATPFTRKEEGSK